MRARLTVAAQAQCFDEPDLEEGLDAIMCGCAPRPGLTLNSKKHKPKFEHVHPHT